MQPLARTLISLTTGPTLIFNWDSKTARSQRKVSSGSAAQFAKMSQQAYALPAHLPLPIALAAGPEPTGAAQHPAGLRWPGPLGDQKGGGWRERGARVALSALRGGPVPHGPRRAAVTRFPRSPLLLAPRALDRSCSARSRSAAHRT